MDCHAQRKNYNGYNVALPAADDPVSLPAKAGSSRDPVVTEDDAVVEEVPEVRSKLARGSAEEARTVEHHMTHMPKNSHCEVCARANVQRKQKRTV